MLIVYGCNEGSHKSETHEKPKDLGNFSLNCERTLNNQGIWKLVFSKQGT